MTDPTSAAGNDGVPDVLARIEREDVIGRYVRRDPPVDQLCAVGESVSCDWFDGIERLVDTPELVHDVEREAAQVIESGYRHVIWAGMGGSVVPLQVVLGAIRTDPSASSAGDRVTIHPLDNTDPAALDALVRDIAGDDADGPSPDHAALREALRGVLLIAVAMGMNSEEPVSHIEWFASLCDRVGLDAGKHIRVLTIPGSALERYAVERGFGAGSVCIAGQAPPPGRFSVPYSRSFLLGLALAHASSGSQAILPILRRARELHALEDAWRRPGEHRFVRLAATLAAANVAGRVRLLPRWPAEAPHGYESLHTYVEQVLEQSLGKQGRGVVVLPYRELNPAGPAYHDEDLVTVAIETGVGAPSDGVVSLSAPELASSDPGERAAAALAHMLGWQLVTAICGYLFELPITTEPAVERYKKHSRELRAQFRDTPPWRDLDPDRPLLIDERGNHRYDDIAAHVSRLILGRIDQGIGTGAAGDRRLGYLDVTVNGTVADSDWRALAEATESLAVRKLGVPVKLRQAPAHYHVAEQSEMDGPDNLVSIRVVPRVIPEASYGGYTGDFLTAAAIGTQRAMREVDRDCVLLVTSGTTARLARFVVDLLADISTEIDQAIAQADAQAPREESRA